MESLRSLCAREIVSRNPNLDLSLEYPEIPVECLYEIGAKKAFRDRLYMEIAEECVRIKEMELRFEFFVKVPHNIE